MVQKYATGLRVRNEGVWESIESIATYGPLHAFLKFLSPFISTNCHGKSRKQHHLRKTVTTCMSLSSTHRKRTLYFINQLPWMYGISSSCALAISSDHAHAMRNKPRDASIHILLLLLLHFPSSSILASHCRGVNPLLQSGEGGLWCEGKEYRHTWQGQQHSSSLYNEPAGRARSSALPFCTPCLCRSERIVIAA